MPPKKKDKTKSTDWLQCSLCDKLVSPLDAEVHSKSCDADHGFIRRKILYGKAINVDGLLLKDGSLVTKNVRNKENIVWFAIPTMQVCSLSIGQPCILNGKVVKLSWPNPSQALASVAMSQRCMEELKVGEGDTVTVERFFDEGNVALSATLTMDESNPLFYTENFCSFVSSYLGGKYICDGMPLTVRYFGNVCSCVVNKVEYTPRTPRLASHLTTPDSSGQTPKPAAELDLSLSSLDSPVKAITPLGVSDDGDTSFNCTHDLSQSLASLNISVSSIESSSTPPTPVRPYYPTLVTPVRSIQQADHSPQSNVFAKVLSGSTSFSVAPLALDPQGRNNKEAFSLEDIGGLSSHIEELRSRIHRAQQASSSSCCVLIHGPAGTGKTMLVKALTAQLGVYTEHLTGTDIWSKMFGEAESNLKKIFKTAQDRAPSIVVIDDIDVLCPKRSQNQTGQQEHRIVGTLISLIDGLSLAKNNSMTVVIGVTSKKDDLDPALRRAGRFGCEIEVGVPTALQRKEILNVLLSKIPNNVSSEDMETIALNAHGFVGADLAALVNEACLQAAGRDVIGQEVTGHDRSSSAFCLRFPDLVTAASQIKPSALREIQLEVTQVRWSDIGGMSEVKMRLREAVELPLSNPEIFKRLGIQPPRGLLMYGPPGCSKTMVARALATECKLNFLAVKGPELFNQYVGESEKAVREIFRKARSAAPSIIFFDEIDAIASKRGSNAHGGGVDDRVLTQLLTEMDGLEFLKDVFIVAATNRPDKIDRALLRPGRFDSLVYVPLPDDETRKEILEKKLKKMSVGEDVDINLLVEETQDYSGAEIIQVCQEAAMLALREDLNAQCVLARHFSSARHKVQPQIDPDLIQIYQKFAFSKIK